MTKWVEKLIVGALAITALCGVVWSMAIILTL